MSLPLRILLFIAGIAGAAGVALAAISTHAAGGDVLALAAQFLILHAAAAAGTVALAARGAGAGRALTTIATAALLVGAVLFSGDLAMRALAGTKLLWGTAPYGGSTMIVGWLALAVGGLLSRGSRVEAD